MFKTIVWASDGSANADQALDVVKTLAREGKASIVAVHVVENYATHSPTGLALHADEELVEERLKGVVEDLSAEGVDASLRTVIHVGPQPAHEIADIAKEAGADLIVTGTRGHGTLPGLLLGSVTQRLLHLAPCPVLVVPAK
jgi:nucleotide-binding universal stress UspA family protein